MSVEQQDQQNIMGDIQNVNPVSEVKEPQASNSEQANKVPDFVPYQRFSEVNSNYKKSMETIAEKDRIIEAMAANVPPQTQQPLDTGRSEIESVDDLFSVLGEKLEEKIAPIQKELAISKFEKNTHAYFNSNPKAAELQPEIDSYFDTLSKNRQQAIVDSIALGDTSVLKELTNTVLMEKQNNLQGMANEQIQSQQNQVHSPSNTKVVKTQSVSDKDLLIDAAKTRNFDQVFDRILGFN